MVIFTNTQVDNVPFVFRAELGEGGGGAGKDGEARPAAFVGFSRPVFIVSKRCVVVGAPTPGRTSLGALAEKLARVAHTQLQHTLLLQRVLQQRSAEADAAPAGPLIQTPGTSLPVLTVPIRNAAVVRMELAMTQFAEACAMAYADNPTVDLRAVFLQLPDALRGWFFHACQHVFAVAPTEMNSADTSDQFDGQITAMPQETSLEMPQAISEGITTSFCGEPLPPCFEEQHGWQNGVESVVDCIVDYTTATREEKEATSDPSSVVAAAAAAHTPVRSLRKRSRPRGSKT